MYRRLHITILVGASLLTLVLLFGGVVGWADSQWAGRTWYLTRGVRSLWLSSMDSGLYLSMQVDASPDRLDVTRYRWAGFEWQRVVDEGWSGAKRSNGLIFWRVGMPYWFAVLAGAGLGVICLRGWRDERRAYRLRHGLCPVCRYDLRATPDMCPECGTAVEPPPPTPSGRPASTPNMDDDDGQQQDDQRGG